MDRFDWTMLAFVLLLLCAIGFGSYHIDRYGCTKGGENLKLPTKYSFFGGGCFIQYEGQWYPWDNFRGNQLSQ